jgi:hypothetical protein
MTWYLGGLILILLALLDKNSAEVRTNYTGVLVDVYCYELPNSLALDGAALRTNPQDHTVHCMRDVPQCSQNGYVLLANQGTDAEPNYVIKYKLDAIGNQMALDALKHTTTVKNFVVSAIGTLPSVNSTVMNVKALVEGTTLPEMPKEVTYTGYIVDLHCWSLPGSVAVDGAPLKTNPEKHTVQCMRDVPICFNSGFGFLENLGSSSKPNYVLKYKLDDNGNAMVQNLLRSTGMQKNFVVSARGFEAPDSVLRVVALSEGESNPVVYTGFVVDLWCWNLPGSVAIDGAPLRKKPQDHTVHCMRDIPQCSANGFGFLENAGTTTNPNYGLRYRFDERGNQMVLKILNSTKTQKDFIMTATGSVDSDNGVFHVQALSEGMSVVPVDSVVPEKIEVTGNLFF